MTYDEHVECDKEFADLTQQLAEEREASKFLSETVSKLQAKLERARSQSIKCLEQMSQYQTKLEKAVENFYMSLPKDLALSHKITAMNTCIEKQKERIVNLEAQNKQLRGALEKIIPKLKVVFEIKWSAIHEPDDWHGYHVVIDADDQIKIIETITEAEVLAQQALKEK